MREAMNGTTRRTISGRSPGWRAWIGSAVAVAALGACSGDSDPIDVDDSACGDLDPAFLADGGVGRDGIPAVTDPEFVSVDDDPQTQYIRSTARVIGVFFDGEWLAVPHNFMFRHEIVNLNRGGEQIAVTYCPITGSALGFDRASVGGAEFGVSGLLFKANLVMFDRNQPEESFWPQMAAEAGCGPRQGQQLVRYPVVETTWGGWQELHPDSKVIGVDPGPDTGIYEINPYGGGFEVETNPDFLGFPISLDSRRPPKERVLGFPGQGPRGALAYPFGAMEERGDLWIGELEYLGAPAVVLWDAGGKAAVALRPELDGEPVTLRVEDGAFRDAETGSTWSVTGEALSGPLAGRRLEVVPEAYVAFWTPWVNFHPETELAIE